MAVLPIFIPHAGCPHQCVFCNQRTISGQHVTAVSAAELQIKHWLDILSPNVPIEAAFYGGSFTGLELALQERLLGLTDALLAQGRIESVRLSTRPDYIDEERLRLLQRHHVRLVELGVQSLDDVVLAVAERGHSAECVGRAHDLLRNFGFATGIQLMVGMPRQSFASVCDTVSKVIALRPDVARIYPLLVIRDTPLARSFVRGEFMPLTLEEAVAQSTYAYSRLTEAGIRVIRIGLQADEELCAEGNILAGPFHPAMGELVRSRALRDELTPRMEELVARGTSRLELRCPRRLESKLRGQYGCNLRFWEERFPDVRLEIVRAEGERVIII
jgi:histone acetyltransferase (RNA polymerase elongator complex component)